MYADDTVIFAHGKNQKEVAKILTKAMENVAKWLFDSCLTLNVGKTVSMYFTNRNELRDCPDICVNGQNIKNVHEFKYLGVTLDLTLNFKKHVKKLANSLKYNIANYRHIRNSLTTEASSTYLNAMILSHLSYCMTSWSQAGKSTLRPLESLYKNALNS